MMSLLKSNEPNRHKYILEYGESHSDTFTVKYDVSKLLKGLAEIKDADLLTWKNKWNKRIVKCKEEALDVLYEIIYPKSQK